MGNLVKIVRKDELKEGQAKVVRVGDEEIAVFRVDHEFFATRNKCLHRGGPLGDGELAGHYVTCPWHGWTYDVRTGSFGIIPTLRVKTYKITEDGEDLFVELA